MGSYQFVGVPVGCFPSDKGELEANTRFAAMDGQPWTAEEIGMLKAQLAEKEAEEAFKRGSGVLHQQIMNARHHDHWNRTRISC